MRTLRFALVSSLAFGLVASGVFACATQNDAAPPDETPETSVIPTPDAAVDAGQDAAAEGGCAETAGCVETTDCTAVDFCSSSFPVTRTIALNAIWGSSASDVWAVGARGTVLHGDGTTFTPITSGTTDTFFAVWGSGPNDVWAIDGTSPLHSTGFANGTATFDPVLGSSWNPDFVSMGRLWTGYGTSQTGVWIGGEATRRFDDFDFNSASIWRLGTDEDAGAIWNAAPACSIDQPCVPAVRAFWGLGGAASVAVGMTGQAFHLDDADAGHWAYENPRTGENLEALWGSSESDLWAVGANGTIRRRTSAAGAWSEVTSPTTNDLHSLWGSAANDVWAVGDKGTMLHFDGTTWKQASIGLLPGDVPTRLLGVWGSGPNDVWVVGEGLILHRTATSRGHS
jgi:photosystem II stability/assembly factor-like uncharacterized protein